MAAVVPPWAAPRTGLRELTFEDCYVRHWERIYRPGLRYGGGNAGWAEDLAHDVFLKPLPHLPRLPEPEDIGGWLYPVARNEALSRLRRERPPLRWLGWRPAAG